MDPSPTGAFEIALQPGQPFTNAQVDDFIIRTTNSNQCMLLGTTSNTPALMTLSNGNLTVRGDLNVVNGSIINNGTQVISSFFNSNADTGSNIFRNSRLTIGAATHPEQFNVYGGNARFDSNAYVLQRLAVGSTNPSVALDVTGTAQISSNLIIGGNVQTANPLYTGGFFIRKNSNAIAATTSLSTALDNIGIATGQMTFSVPDKSSSNTFNFVASNSTNVAAQISGDGRMAIGGVVSPAVGAPVLTVQGASNELLRLTNLAQSVTLGVDTGYGAYIGTTGGPHDLVVAPSNTERMRIKATTGNVGIGTSNPSARLHVVGDTRIQGNLTVNGTTTVIDTNQSTTEQLVITNDGTGPALQITQLGEQPIADFYDDSNVLAMRVANGGNVGIGLSNPTYKLEVGAGGAGAIRATPSNALGLVINQTGATGQLAQFQVNNAPVVTIGRDGYFYDSNNQATWIPGAQVQWLSTTAPVLTVPASGALSNLAASASFRFVGTEVAYTFSTQNRVTTAPTILTGDYTLSLPYNLDATKYATGTIIGELWLTAVNAAATLSNVFKAYARTSALTQSAVILRYLNGTTDASFTDFLQNSTFTLQGTLVYSSSTFANTAPLPPSVIPAAFVQDAQGRVTFNYPGPGPHPNPARLDITETASNATAPALAVNATSNAPLLSLSAAGAPKVYVTAQGSIGVGTSNPQSTLDVRGGNLRLEGTGGNGNFMSYAPIGSNAHIPVSAGKINGVNITALNARVRASYASAAACVNTWTTRTSAADNSWTSVCWAPELSIFVAVANTGTGNRVMTSPDGIVWTLRTSAADNQWNSVCWSPELSLFVAVANSGTGNRVMTSPDGITWTSRTSAADNLWSAVCWSPELSLFVAVSYSGTGNRVMTSPDGIAWTLRTSAADSNWGSVCWAPELSLFVAVATGGTGNRVMTSPDGITWTARTSAANNVWTSVCWSPELSLFVAVAGSGTGNRVMTSPDGITWTTRTNAVDNYWISVCWSPELSLFVAVAYSSTGNPVMTSPDGINWTTRTGAANNQWVSVCWAPELSIFVAVAQSGTGNRVMTSAIGMPNSKSVVKALPSQMTLLPNGNVGIGTVNPQTRFHVNETTTSDTIVNISSSLSQSNVPVTSNLKVTFEAKNYSKTDGATLTASDTLDGYVPSGTVNYRNNTSGFLGQTSRSTPYVDISSNAYYSKTDTFNFGTNGGATLFFLFKLNSTVYGGTVYPRLFSFQSDATIANGRFDVYVDPTDTFGINLTNSTGVTQMSGILNFSSTGVVWQLTTIVVDNTARTVSFYKNGVLETVSNTFATAGYVLPNYTSRALYIGGWHQSLGVSNSMNGSVASCYVYDRVLNASELNLMHNYILRGNTVGITAQPQFFKIDNYNNVFMNADASELIQQNVTMKGALKIVNPIFGLTVQQTGGSQIGLTKINNSLVKWKALAPAAGTLSFSLDGDSLNFMWREDNSTVEYRYFSSAGTVFFTGQHECLAANAYIAMHREDYVGLIVEAVGNYCYKDQYNVLTINDSVPVVNLCSTHKSKKVFGVVTNALNSSDIKDKYELANFGSLGNNIRINSLGEGGIWVCNINGSLENGDYITSSAIPGYGAKQDDDVLHNYTVAKITMDCDFSDVMVAKQELRRDGNKYYIIDNSFNVVSYGVEENGVPTYEPKYKLRYVSSSGEVINKEAYDLCKSNQEPVYIAAFVGCTYHCG